MRIHAALRAIRIQRQSGRLLKRSRPGGYSVCASRCLFEVPNILGLTPQVKSEYYTQQSTPDHRRLFSSFAGASRNESLDDALAALPPNAQLQFDFFGEPVTFQGTSPNDSTANAMAALDGFILAVATKGRTCTGGGGEEGLEMKSAHASAIQWAELLRHAKVWNTYEEEEDEEVSKSKKKRDKSSMQEAETMGGDETKESDDKDINDEVEETQKTLALPKFAPMLVVATVAPVLVQAGKGYIQFLDKLLQHGDSLVPGMGPLQIMPLLEVVLARQDDKALNERERQHIQALEHMMKYDHETALWVYLKILRSCPGDVLALSLAIDLAYTLGDKSAALRYVNFDSRWLQ